MKRIHGLFGIRLFSFVLVFGYGQMNENLDLKNLDSIMTNPLTFRKFFKFMMNEMYAESIMLLYDVNLLKISKDDYENRIQMIFKKYFKGDSDFFIRGFFGIEKKVQETNKNVYDLVCKVIEKDIRIKYFSRFLKSKYYQELSEELFVKKSDSLWNDLIKRFKRKGKNIIKNNEDSIPIMMENYSTIEELTDEYIKDLKKIHKYKI